MDKYNETHRSWDKSAVAYQNLFMDLDIYNDSYDQFCGLLPQNSTLLEVGCGPGNITHYLFGKRPDLKILGTDISEQMLRLAKSNVPHVEFLQLDVRDLYKLDKKFDAIVSGFCIPYISESDTRELFIQSKELLNTDGCMYLSFIPGSPDKSGYVTGSTGNRMYFYYHETSALKKMLGDSGFHIIWEDEVWFKRKTGEREIHAIIIAQVNK